MNSKFDRMIQVYHFLFSPQANFLLTLIFYNIIHSYVYKLDFAPVLWLAIPPALSFGSLACRLCMPHKSFVHLSTGCA